MFLGDGTPMLVYMGGTSATPEKLIFNILNITELNGVVSINQNCYVTSRNEQQGSQDFRAAKYQFNEAGKTYYYCAIG